MQVLHHRSACLMDMHMSMTAPSESECPLKKSVTMRHLRFLAMLVLTLQGLTEQNGVLLWAPCLHNPASDDLGGDLGVLCPHGLPALLQRVTLMYGTRRPPKLMLSQFVMLSLIPSETAVPEGPVPLQERSHLSGILQAPFKRLRASGTCRKMTATIVIDPFFRPDPNSAGWPRSYTSVLSWVTVSLLACSARAKSSLSYRNENIKI